VTRRALKSLCRGTSLACLLSRCGVIYYQSSEMTTDLHHTDETEHAQALFRQLFLASPDAIVVTAVNGRISASILLPNDFSVTPSRS
jgi:hypothetical protein